MFSKSLEAKLFSGADDFFTERSLMQFFKSQYDPHTWRAYKGVLKRIARDAEKAYRVGTENGLAGHQEPTAEGLQEILSGVERKSEMESILSFIYSAAVAGFEAGRGKKLLKAHLRNEAKNETI